MNDRDELALLAFQSAHSLDQGDAYRVVDALWAAGWRKKPTIVQIADQVMLNAIYHGREGSVMDEASRDDFEYDYALQTAHAILALMDGLSDE